MVLIESDEAKPRVPLACGEQGEELIIPRVAREGAGRAAVRHLVRDRVRVSGLGLVLGLGLGLG